MDPRPKDSDGGDDLREDAVVAYLRTHPDFFERHLALLTELVIPHSARGRAVSLVERQVVALRDQLTIERKHLKHLVEAARQNVRLQQRLQRLFETVVLAKDLPELLQTLPERLQSEFDLAAVEIRFLDARGRQHIPLSHLIAADDNSAISLAQRLSGRSCLVEAPLSADVIAQRDGLDRFRNGSGAVLPITGQARALIGWMILISEDKKHYAHDMDTALLEGLGGVVSAACARFHPA